MANDKPTTGGTGYVPEASSPEAIKNMANFFGTYFLKGLGVLGQLMTAPLTQPDPVSSAHKSREQIEQERAIQNEAERQVGTVMSYLSPLNYGVALATGNGLDPIAGEEEIAQWEPYQQALARGAELYTIPKVTKGISKGISKAYERFGRKQPVTLIEPEANPEHFRFTNFYDDDYWTPIQYAEESPQFEYTFTKGKNPKNFRHPEVHEHPGRQFKSLMKGSPLEAQVDGYGYINVKALRSYFGEPKKLGRGRSLLERQIVNEILDSPLYRGKKKVYFDQFKEDVFYKLHNLRPTSINPLHRKIPIERLGYHTMSYGKSPKEYQWQLLDRFPERFVMEDFGDIKDLTTGKLLTPDDYPNYKDLIDYYTNVEVLTTTTPDFDIIDMEPRRILGKVNNVPNRSLSEGTTFSISTEPDILYVSDIDSRWATRPKNPIPEDASARAKFAVNKLTVNRLTRAMQQAQKQGASYAHLLDELTALDFNFQLPMLDPQLPFLKRTFFRRQVQQILNRAAEHGKTKVRFPTEETFLKSKAVNKILNPERSKLVDLSMKQHEEAMRLLNLYGKRSPEFLQADELVANTWKQYESLPEYIFPKKIQLQINRFNNIPKILKQLLPDQETRIVTDSKGNTWVEVDVPWNYQYTEQMYKKGGKLNGKRL